MPPRWGFPARAWVPPAPVSTRATAPADQLAAAVSLAGSVVSLLRATAVIAVVAAGAEGWRYGLLLASRAGALSAGAVAASDALVSSAAWIAMILALLAGGLGVRWTLRATQAAAELAGVRPSRTSRAIVVGWLVPGINLTVPGSVLAEIEHAAIGRPAGTRPRPSRLLLAWWVLWAGGVVLTTVVALWSLRSGVQAQADGVVLHAVLDLLAAVIAVMSAKLMVRLTRLLNPDSTARREIVVRIGSQRQPAEPSSAAAGPVPAAAAETAASAEQVAPTISK